MRIEIWTDVICPWCGLGEHRLHEALRRFDHAGEVEVVHRSFQLDERAPVGSTRAVREMLVSDKGLARHEVDRLVTRIERLAHAEGLQPYIVGDNRVGNTSLAHQLAAWASAHGRGAETWAALYKAYFGEARSIFDVDSLVTIAGELGLDRKAAREVLVSERYAGQVRAEGREARELGASGVPFIVIDRRYAIAGAQPVHTIVEALDAAWKQRSSPAQVGATEARDGSCGPDGCSP
jgi:predicted DsbA family dithiol-disulfide isomerase